MKDNLPLLSVRVVGNLETREVPFIPVFEREVPSPLDFLSRKDGDYYLSPRGAISGTPTYVEPTVESRDHSWRAMNAFLEREVRKSHEENSTPADSERRSRC